MSCWFIIAAKSFDEWRSQVQDTLTNTVFNKQSCMSTESHVSVPIDVCGCSSIDERERTEMRKTGNFLSILSNISCGYVVNMSTANDRGLPPYPLSFSQQIYTIWKNDPWGHPEFHYKLEHSHPCSYVLLYLFVWHNNVCL